MSIIGNLQSKGVMQEYQKGLYYLDYNKNKKQDANEPAIPDDNKNGKTDLKEYLEFITAKGNNIQIETLIATKNVINEEKETDEDLLSKIKEKYLPNIEANSTTAINNKIKLILNQYALLEEDYRTSLENFDEEKAAKLKQQMKEIGESEQFCGYITFTLKKSVLIVLTSGETVNATKIYIDECCGKINGNNDILGAEFQTPIEKELPGGEKVSIKEIRYAKNYDETKKKNNIETITLSKNSTVFGLSIKAETQLWIHRTSSEDENCLSVSWDDNNQFKIELFPNNKLKKIISTSGNQTWTIFGKFKAQELEYYDDGKTIKMICVKEPIELILKDGRKVSGTSIYFDENQEIIDVKNTEQEKTPSKEGTVIESTQI